MSFSIITKAQSEAHNLTDYDAACASFSWQQARDELDGLPNDGGLNIAYEAVDRHLATRGDQDALRCVSRRGTTVLTYRELAAQTNRFANVLADLGISAGDRVFTLAGCIPELYVAVLGALKHRCIVCPLFSAFGPEPIATRMTIGKARVLVTTERLFRRKIAPIRDQLSDLEHVLLVEELGDMLATRSASYAIAPTAPDEPALLHFTSGTTGTPKGAVHVHEAVVAHHHTGRVALDLHSGDRYWCTADPGWVTGTSYGIVAPLTCGVTLIAYDGPFDVTRWYDVLEKERVAVWYTAPTAVRMCMRVGADVVRRYDLSSLRFIGSVGEPLNPEAVVWGREAFGMAIHDNWWQTETGAIMIANFASCDVKPGSMGQPIPGIEAAIIDGELRLKTPWPSMFRGYLDEDERYQACFADGWYLTGDLVKRDKDGYFWFVGRADDVIKSAGHLVGPFEVESGLLEHEAVVEAAVIGKPDPVAGNIIKAFVSLRTGVEASDDLSRELIAFARKRLGTAVAPREIAFDQNLPKTRSGKIMRRLLRARELGLPEGDLSTLEEATS